MAGIPNDQLTTWAGIGAQTTSKDTYDTVKLALEKENTPYAGKAAVFLQGSYGNDTNIYRESDVDVVIRLDSIFTYDISALPPSQREEFKRTHLDATYTHKDFQRDVLAVLNERFKADVEPGNKAVLINPRGNRRKTDVIIAVRHKKFHQYTGVAEADNPIIGIAFHKKDGSRVINYPTQHRDHLRAKNQATNEWFKHLIRIFKNARQRLIEDGVIEEGVAPSYYIEGLLYNVPNENYGTSYEASMHAILTWLHSVDLSKLWCANLQYPLLNGNADVTWNTENCKAYIGGLIELWNDW